MAKQKTTSTAEQPGALLQAVDERIPEWNSLNKKPAFYVPEVYGRHDTVIHSAVAMLEKSTQRAIGMAALANILYANACEIENGDAGSSLIDLTGLHMAMACLANDMADDLFNHSYALDEMRVRQQTAKGGAA